MRTATHDISASAPSRTELRRFGLVFGLAITVIFGLLVPWVMRRPYPHWPWVPGALLVSSALVWPNALRIIHAPWMRLALLLNRLTTPVLAGAVFFIVISPVGWIMRITGKDPMTRRFDREAPSYRVLSRNSRPGDMERQF
jgi:hypothetical protein